MKQSSAVSQHNIGQCGTEIRSIPAQHWSGWDRVQQYPSTTLARVGQIQQYPSTILLSVGQSEAMAQHNIDIFLGVKAPQRIASVCLYVCQQFRTI